MYLKYLCIYVAMYLCTYTAKNSTSGLAAHGAWEQLVMHLNTVIKWKYRYNTKLWCNESGDELRGGDGVNPEMLLDEVTERDSRYTWMLWSSTLYDAFGGSDC